MIESIVSGINASVGGLFIGIVEAVLDGIFAIIGNVNLPQFSTYAQYLQDFWDLCFQFVGYIRSIFLIDSFSMNLIILSITIRYLSKPTIALIKMVVHWWDKLKL